LLISLLHQLKNKKSQNDYAAKVNINATKFFSLIEKINFQDIADKKFVIYYLNIEESVTAN